MSKFEPGAGQARQVVVVLPGQGVQKAGMGVGLYLSLPAFAERVDHVLDHWGREGASIRSDWLSESPAVGIDDIRRSQPLLFAIDWALGSYLLDQGVSPAAVVGHSAGELAASVLAGILDLADATILMADRLVQLADAPAGAMLAVAAKPEDVRFCAELGVDIGAVNAPRQVVLAGSVPDIDRVAGRLAAAGISARLARSPIAFHSDQITEHVLRSVPTLEQIEFRDPTQPLWSAYTGAPLTAEQIRDTHFWARQPALPVLFWPTLSMVLDTVGPALVVEAGPGRSLTTAARRHRSVVAGTSSAVALLPHANRSPEQDRRAFEEALEVIGAARVG
ncbi:acyltransferase domain-containing protein [Rhodococcus jostii]|uniref:Acyltransferase domain-containing protein n=1 Tax=Rhodococcus jostii TaxID=132919 RepID=A0ABU4CT89_RHOJO|nr:acyltransferase domain-containing protein [Rhodococcus jostii]MDV6286789.1 acyltransferase domain-containing protein [Rhodococcus jostii]